jgi:hypothetical protein
MRPRVLYVDVLKVCVGEPMGAATCGFNAMLKFVAGSFGERESPAKPRQSSQELPECSSCTRFP